MIPVYVISRDDAPERLVALWADAERLGISISRIRPEGPAEENQDTSVPNGHRRAWERIADGDAPYAVVLHDDVELGEELLPLLDRSFLAKSLPPRSVLVLDGPQFGVAEELSDAAIVRPISPPNSFHAYIISRVAVRSLLASPKRVELPAKTIARKKEHGIETFLVVPPPVATGTREKDVEAAVSRWGVERLAGWGRNLASRLAPRDSHVFEPIPVPSSDNNI